MEIVTEKMITDKTLTGVSPNPQTSDGLQTILKPNLEETVGDDLGSVVVTTTVVEETEVSVVKMVQEEEEGEQNEVTGNEKEGLFGNLVDRDEGLKGENENGTSVVMDVEGLKGENGSCINPVFGEKSGGLGNTHDLNASADPMDVCSPEQNEKNGDENFESKEEMNVIVEKEDNGEKIADHDNDEHSFVVGDFVWGKIKSHPWWPGQIYDPSDASDYAATLKHKGELLVAYFGDRSFSWCEPSQLMPFINNFEEMSKQSDSKKFVNAVQKVLEVVSRRVEMELMCKCQTVKMTKNAGVVNSGIKKGARAPKGNTIKVLIERIDPVEVVSTLKGYATMEPGTKLVGLELTVLKSCLRAFFTKKSGSLLADYHDPKCIEGLEEETRNVVVGDSDITGPSESAEDGDDKYQRRKQKSVAELMGEDESKPKKVKTTKDGGTKERKRKMLVVSVTHENDHESGGGGVEDETMSPRQRKKSRYLSPPYLSPIGVGSGKLSVLGSGAGAGSFKEPKPEPEKVPEMAAKQLDDSLKKSSGKKAREKRRVLEGSDPQEYKKAKADAVVSVAKVLDGLLRAALDPSSFVKKEKNHPTIAELVSSFRSSIFKEGSQTGKTKDDGDKSCNQTGKMKDGEDKSGNQSGKTKDGEDKSGKQTGKKKGGKDKSELAFIEKKLEWMSEMVQKCEESEMSAGVKASLQGGLQEVLGKVVKMRGKRV